MTVINTGEVTRTASTGTSERVIGRWERVDGGPCDQDIARMKWLWGMRMEKLDRKAWAAWIHSVFPSALSGVLEQVTGIEMRTHSVGRHFWTQEVTLT